MIIIQKIKSDNLEQVQEIETFDKEIIALSKGVLSIQGKSDRLFKKNNENLEKNFKDNVKNCENRKEKFKERNRAYQANFRKYFRQC